jgi:hypothetical protein
MKKGELKYDLRSKTKAELQIIAKELKIPNYFALDKNELSKKIINHKASNKILTKFGYATRPFYKRGTFIIGSFLVTFIVAIVTYFLSNLSTKHEFDKFENKYLKTQEYLTYIQNVETINSTLLKGLFNGGYQIFGIRDQGFVTLTKFEGIVKMKNLKSQIMINYERKRISLSIDYQDFNIKPDPKIVFIIQDSQCKCEIKLGNVGELILIPCFDFKTIHQYFVLLNDNLLNPVFAIGIQEIV